MNGQPKTRYATAADGSQIAYQVVGEGRIDLVYLTGSLSHVDVRWEHPAGARFYERLASFTRLILFDRRGVGASDRFPIDMVPTWEEWAQDLQVVLDATDSRSAALFAVADGRDMALTFAASHPERVTALVLFHPYGSRIPPEEFDSVMDMQQRAWGTDDWVKVVAPSIADDPVQTAYFTKMMRATATPRAITAQTRATWQVNTDFVLPSLHVPTMVLHRRGRPLTVETVRKLTEEIPDARFIDIPGTDLPPQTQNAGLVLDIVEEFLTGVKPAPKTDRFLATVLFTDIVDSTRLASSIGDQAWRERLDAHDETIRAELERHGGREINTTGDGFFAIFDGPSRAIDCARAICQSARHRLGIEVRAGLHTGEVESRDQNIGGIAVHIGARVAAAAGAGEVLVSRTVTDLVAGSGLDFEDRGEHELKGVPGRWRLFALAD